MVLGGKLSKSLVRLKEQESISSFNRSRFLNPTILPYVNKSKLQYVCLNLVIFPLRSTPIQASGIYADNGEFVSSVPVSAIIYSACIFSKFLLYKES